MGVKVPAADFRAWSILTPEEKEATRKGKQSINYSNAVVEVEEMVELLGMPPDEVLEWLEKHGVRKVKEGKKFQVLRQEFIKALGRQE